MNLTSSTFLGEPARIRTAGREIKSFLLYQLSYGPKKKIAGTSKMETVCYELPAKTHDVSPKGFPLGLHLAFQAGA